VHYYNSTQYCNTETVLFNISLPPDQHHISDMVTSIQTTESPMECAHSQVC